MKEKIITKVKALLAELSSRPNSGGLVYRQGNSLYLNGQCKKLSESETHFEFLVDDKHGDYFVTIDFDGQLRSGCTCKSQQLCRHQIASYLQLNQRLSINLSSIPEEGIKYSREGMIKRVIEERRTKAKKAKYAIEFADNIYGEHLLTNEKGTQYNITFRDLERKHGYCSCPDYRTNKLGTCKHLIFAFEKISADKSIVPENLPGYPFIEVFLNPFRENKISWFHPEKPSGEVAELLYRYFGHKNFIEDDMADSFTGFINKASKHKQILIRPEVPEKVNQISEAFSMARLKQQTQLSFPEFKTNLLPFQKEGIKFATFNTGAIIADEMGLGKSIQAIGSALLKRQLFGFQHTLIVCPASLKSQWGNEIEQFTGEVLMDLEDAAIGAQEGIIPGKWPFFTVISYEALAENFELINDNPPGFLILDEAQRLINYENQIFTILRAIPRKHILALTGVPIKSKLIELYSLVLLVDPGLLTPLWEFSYQHCYFDKDKSNKITGFYNLDKLNKKLEKVLIRRQKHEVIDELPTVSKFDIPVKMHPAQISLHKIFVADALDLVNKNHLSKYDVQQLAGLARNMRMACNSTYLIDNSTNVSPKLEELDHILNGKLDIRQSKRRVVIFTEWKRMMNIIAKMLENNKVDFVEITEDMPAKNKQLLLTKFKDDDECKILLATDGGADGLNFTMADTIINFDAPLSTSQKNLRFGSIGDFGKNMPNLTIINLISDDSIETWPTQQSGLDQNLIDKIFAIQDADQAGEITQDGKKKLKDELEKLREKLNAIKYQESTPAQAKPATGQMVLDFSDDDPGGPIPKKQTNQLIPETTQGQKQTQNKVRKKELQMALKSGVDFFSQLINISTGKSVDLKGKDINVDMDSGEIVIKFKFSDTPISNTVKPSK